MLLPLLKLLGFSFFHQDTVEFVKKLVEKIRSERDGGSQQVCTAHTRTRTHSSVICLSVAAISGSSGMTSVFDQHRFENALLINHQTAQSHLEQKTMRTVPFSRNLIFSSI